MRKGCLDEKVKTINGFIFAAQLVAFAGDAPLIEDQHANNLYRTSTVRPLKSQWLSNQQGRAKTTDPGIC